MTLSLPEAVKTYGRWLYFRAMPKRGDCPSRPAHLVAPR